MAERLLELRVQLTQEGRRRVRFVYGTDRGVRVVWSEGATQREARETALASLQATLAAEVLAEELLSGTE